MNGVEARFGVQGVMALRAQILEQSTSIRHATGTPPAPTSGQPANGAGFAAAMDQAVQAVNALQGQSSAQAAAWERGETHDIASVMLARQKASVAFDATVQVRNRLLGAYRDIMNMPV